MATAVHLALLLSGLTSAWAQELPLADGPPPGLETRVAPGARRVRATPDREGARVGLLAPDAPFFVWERAPSTAGCDEGWARVAPDRSAWTCLDTSVPTDRLPTLLPGRAAFDPPRPEEAADYRSTGAWPRDDTDPDEALLPFVYLTKRRGLSGPVFPSVEALQQGRDGSSMPSSTDLAFSRLLPDPKGEIAVAPDGRAVRLDTLFSYAPSRFHGIDFEEQPLPAGRRPGFSISRQPIVLRSTPAKDGEEVGTLAYHEAFWIDDTAAPPRGWMAVEDPTGIRPPGFAPEDGTTRRWEAADLPEDLADAVWIDVDLRQQMLAVREGAALRYLTLVSTGKDGHETLRGTFDLTDKSAWWDMASSPGSADPYRLESVPWTMHFWPRYALHGAYWHDLFGRVVSHGCINLAPRDAAWVFEHVEPHLHEGWQVAYADDEDEGTTLRVRRGSDGGADRRAKRR